MGIFFPAFAAGNAEALGVIQEWGTAKPLPCGCPRPEIRGMGMNAVEKIVAAFLESLSSGRKASDPAQHRAFAGYQLADCAGVLIPEALSLMGGNSSTLAAVRSRRPRHISVRSLVNCVLGADADVFTQILDRVPESHLVSFLVLLESGSFHALCSRLSPSAEREKTVLLECLEMRQTLTRAGEERDIPGALERFRVAAVQIAHVVAVIGDSRTPKDETQSVSAASGDGHAPHQDTSVQDEVAPHPLNVQ